MEKTSGCNRRLVRVRMASDMLGKFCKIGNRFVVEQGLPKGATLRGFYFDAERYEIQLLFECEEFSEVAEGCLIPFVDVQIRTGEEEIEKILASIRESMKEEPVYASIPSLNVNEIIGKVR